MGIAEARSGQADLLVSPITYARYCFFKTLKSSEPVSAGPNASSFILGSETELDRRAWLGRKQHSITREMNYMLRSTLGWAIHEQGLQRLTWEAAEALGYLTIVKGYIINQVEELGVEFAQQTGWLKGEPPDNPFCDVGKLATIWHAYERHQHLAVPTKLQAS